MVGADLADASGPSGAGPGALNVLAALLEQGPAKLTEPGRSDAPLDTGVMKVYFAGPLFTTSQRGWNAEVTDALRAAGPEVFLPQEKEPGQDAAGIFATDKAGIDWSETLVAIMDGLDPDAGTSWEVGYTFGVGKPIVLVRTDFRVLSGVAGDYNPMLTEAATIRLDLASASTRDVVSAILGALTRIQPDSPA